MAQPQPAQRVLVSGSPVSGYTTGLAAPTVTAARPGTLISSVRTLPTQPPIFGSPVTYTSPPLTGTTRVVTGPAQVQSPLSSSVLRTAVAGSPTAATTTAAPATRTFLAPVYSQAPGGPVAAPTIIRSGVPITTAAPIRIAAAQPQPQIATAVTSQTRPHTLAGPGYTQGAYEAKHQDDPQLRNLKELRKTSGLKLIPVSAGLKTLKESAIDGKLSREQFLETYGTLLEAHGVELPEESVRNAVFDLFDRDENNVVDMMELICGISLLCSGSEDDKIHAVFDVFDENGDGFITMDEMFKFLTSVFKVVLTPNVMGVMNSMGVAVESAEDLASVTSLECFKTADLNHDGKLSVSEFKNWFYAPRNDPSFLFSPVRKLLQ